MKRTLKRILCLSAAAVCAAATLFCLSSCFDYEEMNKLLLLTALGIDSDNDGYRVSVQVTQSKQNGEQTTMLMAVKSENGKSMTEAVGKIRGYYTEPIYFEHLKLIVISEEVAAVGLEDLIDFMEIMGPTFDFEIAVAMKCTALDIITAGSQSDKINAVEMAQVISENNVVFIPPSVKAYELMSDKSDFVLPGLTLSETENEASDSSGGEENRIIRPEGGAAVSKKKMTGRLNSSECGLLLLASATTENCRVSLGEGEALNVLSNERKLSVSNADGGTVKVSLLLKTDGTLTDISKTEKALTEMTKAALCRIYRELSCDALGVEQMFSAYYPGLFENGVTGENMPRFEVTVTIHRQAGRRLME